MSTDSVTITVPGAPRTKKNHGQILKFGNRNVPVASKAFRKYENMVLPKMAEWKSTAIGVDLPIRVPVNVRCRYWIDANRNTDLVGLLQGTLDIMVKAGILKDDSAWNERIAVGYDGSRIIGKDKENARVEITITRIE